MNRDDIKRVVAEQICNMLDNNIVCGFGGECFKGWLEDGNIFYNGGEGYSEDEIKEIMAFVEEIADLVDDLSWKLDPENDF